MEIKKRQKTGGRQKGTPNKRTLEAIDVFDELEFCPLREIIERLKKHGKGMDEKLYLDTCAKLAKFKFAERKAVEHSFDPKELSDSELLEETERLLREAREGIE
jgi:hypothetical protein